MDHSAEKITLRVGGMTCNNCAMGVARTLENKGFTNVNVNFSLGEASLTVPSGHSVEEAIHSVNTSGFTASLPTEAVKEGGLSRVEKLFYLSLPFSITLFAHMFFPHDWWINNPWLQLGLCLPVYVMGVLHFGKSALGSLRIGVPNMDVLIFTGSTAAFGYSIAGSILFWGTPEVHNYLFFETTATIITLVLLGNVLEHRSVKQTTTALRDLTALKPEKARRVFVMLRYEQTEDVDVDQLNIGDQLLVNTGDRIPVDGVVIEGSGWVDTSLMTGESDPVQVQAGEQVVGGTILTDGSLKMEAQHVGDQTLLARIITLVKEAQQNQPAIQRWGDRVSAIFVPVVLFISLATFFTAWLGFGVSTQAALLQAIAVLVISCPCAMGLATPTAVMAGIGRAAKNGILIRGGDTLEKLAGIKTMLFDKTGTLTTGRFTVTGLTTYDEVSEETVKNVLFSLEQHSSHPLAQSLVEHWRDGAQNIPLSGIKEMKGIGIEGTTDDGSCWQAGSTRILPEEAQVPSKSHSIYLIRDAKLIAGIDLEDELRTGTPEALSDLSQRGIRSVMVSGDRREKCEQLAGQIPIEHIHAEQLPDQKLEVIRQESERGPTAMVGDGVNDAPALAKATVGISFGNATPVALQSAQVVLLNHKDLRQLTLAHHISQHTLITIKQNLFWAFFYNIIAIPVAAFGFLNPMVAALAMAVSDVIVIGNSIRLKYKKLG